MYLRLALLAQLAHGPAARLLLMKQKKKEDQCFLHLLKSNGLNDKICPVVIDLASSFSQRGKHIQAKEGLSLTGGACKMCGVPLVSFQTPTKSTSTLTNTRTHTHTHHDTHTHTMPSFQYFWPARGKNRDTSQPLSSGVLQLGHGFRRDGRGLDRSEGGACFGFLGASVTLEQAVPFLFPQNITETKRRDRTSYESTNHCMKIGGGGGGGVPLQKWSDSPHFTKNRMGLITMWSTLLEIRAEQTAATIPVSSKIF